MTRGHRPRATTTVRRTRRAQHFQQPKPKPARRLRRVAIGHAPQLPCAAPMKWVHTTSKPWSRAW